MVLRRLGAAGLVLVVLAACSSDNPTPTPPRNVSTLFVHTLYASGPVGPNGHTANEGAAGNVNVSVHRAGGSFTDAKTDSHGNATLLLAPGAYTAWAHDCASGIKYPVKVRLPGHGGAAQVNLYCRGVG
jgi:hypothetical protein